MRSYHIIYSENRGRVRLELNKLGSLQTNNFAATISVRGSAILCVFSEIPLIPTVKFGRHPHVASIGVIRPLHNTNTRVLWVQE